MLFSQTHNTQLTKREMYINAVGDWQSRQRFTLFGTATFEYKNTFRKEEVIKTCSYFLNALDRKIYTHKEVLSGNRIERFVYIEGGKDRDNLHMHYFCKGETLKETHNIIKHANFLWNEKVHKADNMKILINEIGEDRSTYGMKEFWQMDDDNLVVQLCHLKQSKSF